MSDALMNKFMSSGEGGIKGFIKKKEANLVKTPEDINERKESRSKLAENVSKNFFPSPRKNSKSSVYSHSKAIEIENKIKDYNSKQNDNNEILNMINQRIKQQNNITNPRYEDDSYDEEERVPYGVSRSYQKNPKNLDYYMNKYKNIDRKETKKERKQTKRRNEDDEDDDDDYRKEREKRKLYMYEQQRELDELRQDIDVEIKRLMRTNKIEDLQEVMQEIDDIKYQIRKEKNDRKNSQNPEFHKLLDSIVTLKNDIDKKLSEGSHENNKRLNILREEFKGFKDDINEKVETLEKKQIQQLFGMKYILENDPYIKNKEKIQYLFSNIDIQPNNNLSRRSPDENELKNVLSGKRSDPPTIKVNSNVHKLKETPQEHSKNEHKSNTNNHQFKLRDIPNHPVNNNKTSTPNNVVNKNTPTPTSKIKKLSKINLFRSKVLAIMWLIRIRLILKRAKKKLSTESLKYFAGNYENIDNQFRTFVYNSMKKAYQFISGNDLLNIDFTEKAGPFIKSNEEKGKKKYESIVACFTEILKCLDELADEKNIKKNFLEYLLNLVSNNSYVPRKFFCYFELIRLEFIEGKVLINLTKEQQLMILTIFIIGKICIKDIFLDNKFIKTNFKSAKGIKNLKIVSSILYHSMIELFIDLAKVSKDLKPVDDNNLKKKTIFSTKKSNESSTSADKIIESKKKKFVNYDPSYDKEYNNFLLKRNDNLSIKEEEIINTLNDKLPNYSPDTLVDHLEFLQDKLFSKEDIKEFYELASKNNYSLSSKIKGWSERLLGTVIKEIDDINADDNDNNGSNID